MSAAATQLESEFVERQVAKEEAELAAAIAEKRPGMRAFLARDNRHQSVILIGVKGAFDPKVHCRDGEHTSRALRYITRYNAASAFNN